MAFAISTALGLSGFLRRNTEPLVMSVPPSAASLTKADKLALFIDALKAEGDRTFKLLRGIENMSSKKVRGLPAAGTVLQVGVDALLRANIKGDGTVGFVARESGLSNRQLHLAFCACWSYSYTITGTCAGERLEWVTRRRGILDWLL